MIRTYGASGSQLQYAEVWGQITRADGTVEAPMLLDKYESITHRLKRWGRRVLPFIGLAVLAYASHHTDPGSFEKLAPLGAATVITNAGQAIVTNLVSGIGGTVPGYVAWGTGAGTAAVADTTLFTESTEEARTNGTKTRVTTTVTNDTYQVVGTITVVTSSKTITNVGLFDASTSGNLFFKSDFTGLALAIGDSITFTLKTKYS